MSRRDGGGVAVSTAIESQMAESRDLRTEGLVWVQFCCKRPKMLQKARVSSRVRKGIRVTVNLNLSEPKKQTHRSKTGRESSHRLK